MVFTIESGDDAMQVLRYRHDNRKNGVTLGYPRMRYEPRNFYLRSEAEMAALFHVYEGALENTQKIADMCHLEFTFGKYHLPGSLATTF